MQLPIQRNWDPSEADEPSPWYTDLSLLPTDSCNAEYDACYATYHHKNW